MSLDFELLHEIRQDVKDLRTQLADIDKRLAVSEAKHGLLGAVAGAVVSAMAYFVYPRH